LKKNINENNKNEVEEMIKNKSIPADMSPTLKPYLKENLSYIIVCNDFKKWVKNNAKMNPSHSIFYRNKYYLRLLKFLCYRNNLIHTCRYSNEEFNISYHVIDIGRFKDSLSDWKNYQIASVLQKPYIELINDERLEKLKEKNIINAVKFLINRELIY